MQSAELRGEVLRDLINSSLPPASASPLPSKTFVSVVQSPAPRNSQADGMTADCVGHRSILHPPRDPPTGFDRISALESASHHPPTMSPFLGCCLYYCLLLLFSLGVQGNPEYPRVTPEQVHLSYPGKGPQLPPHLILLLPLQPWCPLWEKGSGSP